MIKIVFLVNFILAASAQQIHLEMTEEERLNTFHTTKDISGYEIVPFRIEEPRRFKRSIDTTQFNITARAFGKHIKLWLDPVVGTLFTQQTPIYRILRDQKGSVRIYKDDELFSYMMKSMYRDIEKASTLMVRKHSNGKTNLHGTVNHGGEEVMVEPVPDRLYSKVENHRRNIDNIPEKDRGYYHYHVVTQVKRDQRYPADWTGHQRRTLQQKSEKIRFLYPELLLVLTHDYYKYFNRNLPKLLTYQIAFWSSVDLRFRSLARPAFRLNIAAIAIAEDPDVLDYFRKNQRDSRVMYNDILGDFGDWLGQHNSSIPSKSYDLAITVTNKVLCGLTDRGDCVEGTIGLANVAAICSEDEYEHRVLKVAMIHDSGNYVQVMAAAHEIGHSLGALHDNKGNITCKTDKGYLMNSSPVYHSTVSSEWSNCTRGYMTNFLRKTFPTCLLNKPTQQNKVARLLPGKLMSLDSQCVKLAGGRVCDKGVDPCFQLACYNKAGQCQYFSYGAADGTVCARFSICILGKCVRKTTITA